MKINPNLTLEKTIGKELKKTVSEQLIKKKIGNNVSPDLPKGVNGNYFHHNLIKNTDTDIEQTIENFNDIKDTKSIEKICYCWMEDYTKLLEDFSPQKVSDMKNVKEEHQSAINRINKKYEKFTNKLSDMLINTENAEDAENVFTNYIEPVTRLSMETYSKIDRMSLLSKAYQIS